MSQSVFKPAALYKRSFFQKVFNQYPEENAVIELNNLLSTVPIQSISKKEVADIEAKYKVSLEKDFKLNLEEFYAVYLNYCLRDALLSDEELRTLQHLKHVLNLTDRTIDALHEKVGGLVYKKSFEEAVADGRLSSDEEKFLLMLQSQVRLPKAIAEKISAEVRTTYIQDYVKGIIHDERLSPDEEREMQAIAKSLNIQIELNKETREQLQRLKLYWALENLELPILDTDIHLQKNEHCYLAIKDVDWHELRTVRKRNSYSGYSTSFKVAKGFYLRSGSYTPTSYSSQEMKLINRGVLYLTNKRILFMGTDKNSNIKLEKILNITPYSDGVEIDKETGKSPVLILPKQADMFCIMLERLLRERG